MSDQWDDSSWEVPTDDPPHLNPPPPPGSRRLAYGLGALLIGPAIAVVIPVVMLPLVSTSLGVWLVVAIGVPLAVPLPFLASPRTRPWAVGTLIGVALTLIVLGGACAALLASWEYQ